MKKFKPVVLTIYGLVICISVYAQQKVDLPLAHLKLNSAYGYRIHPVTSRADFHKGVDLAARNQAVYCILDGQVIQMGYNSILGNYVRVSHGPVVSIYGHLSFVLVTKGDVLKAGDPLGISGSSGRVTGPHLHFSVFFDGHYLNPLRFLLGLFQPKLRQCVCKSVKKTIIKNN